MSGTPKIEGLAADHGGLFWLPALIAALVSLAVPLLAWGDIYRWTDEHGRVNFSNILPAKSGKAKDVEVVLKEAKRTAIPDHVATATEQALLGRIESLERRLREQQYAAPAPVPAAPPANPYVGYYPPAPPPPPNYYDSGYYPGSYYPTYYYPVAPSYVVYPARAFVGRAVFVAPRGGSIHGGGGHAGGGRGGRR